MDRGVACVIDLRRARFGPFPAKLDKLLRELPMQVSPLGEAQIRDKMRPATIDELAMRKPLGKCIGEELP